MNNDNFETNKSVKSSVNEDVEKVNEGIIKDTKKEILKETLNKSGNSSLADNLDALDTLEAGSKFIYHGFKYFEIENELKEAQKEYLYYDSIPNPTREQRKEREKARTKYNNCLGNYVKSGSEVASSGASVVSNIVNAPPVVSILAENMVSGLSSAFGTALSNFIFSITKNVSEKEKIMNFLLYEDSYEEEPPLNIVRKGKENAKQSYDPLVIDIDDDGFDMKKIKDGVYFDLDEKGFKEKTTWIDKKDGILSLDLNKDGEINKGSEIFGDTFIKKDGAYAKSSIDALASYDENNDGVIDENDKIFDELLVWQDINGDGISDIDEIKKLSEYKIISINLNEKQGYERNINGSILKNTITYTKINYENNKIKGKIGEFVLEKDNIDVITEDLLKNIDKSDVESKALAEKIKKLPNIRAFSRVNTLHNEMFLDKTGQLIKLVEQFSKEISIDKKDEIIDNILIKIGKAESIDENERGQYINGKYVKVLENLFDEELEKGQLNQRRAEFYKGSYNNIKQMYYAMLTIQTKFKEIDGLFSIKDNKMVNIELLNNYTYLKMLENPETSTEYFKEMSRVMLYLDSSNVSGINQFKEYFAKISPKYLDILAKANTNIYNGTSSPESMSLYTDNSTIDAGEGNDNITGTFNGHSGNDYFYGGKGNDTISGGVGSDTYFFNLGDGQDTIYESSNQNDFNTIVLGKGITKENIEIHRLNQSDIVLEIKDTTDKITLKGQIGINPAINKIYFENGQTLISEEIKNIANTITTKSDYIEGTKEADTISLLQGDDIVYSKDGDDVIHGNEGHDTIYSENGNDTVYGDEGDDKIYAGYGDDKIIGGKGNDTLDGSYGNDTYIFNIGDGQDIISDYDSNNSNLDKIQLDKNIKEEDIILKRNGDNLEITFKNNTQDKITINNQFSSKYYTIEEIHYGENGIIHFREMLDKTNEESIKQNILKGSYTDDKFIGTDKDDTITSYDGDDIIIAGKGNDKIDGGYGNDTYYYNKGNGTDEIYDSSGYDTLVFGEGITKEDIEFNRVSSSDIAINFKNSQEKIILKYQYNNDVIDKIIFEEGSSITSKEIKDQLKVVTNYDDYLEGTSNNDTFKAEDGDDKVYAGYGNDTIVGGRGNDYLQGGEGSDTYIFSKGDGQDIIYDNGYYDSYYKRNTTDKIVFTDINKEDIYFTKENSSDITIKVKDSEDKITIKNAHSNDWQVEEIHFANGEVLTYEEMMKEQFKYYGDDSDNTITSYGQKAYVKAGAGNDTITTSGLDDEIYAEDGDDTIQAGYGNDTIVGGKGNDYLQGGEGSDTYIFSKGDGQDIIYDDGYYDSYYKRNTTDKIVFTDINKEDVIFTKENSSDVTIRVRDSEDKITIKNAHSNDWQVEEIHFANGEVLTYEEMMKEQFKYYGDDSDNTITSYGQKAYVKAGAGNDTITTSGLDDEIYAEDGDDTIQAGYGNDTIVGGKGNDYLQGGEGSDTYIFSKGDGQDIIYDDGYYDSYYKRNTTDKIVFTDINKEDVIFTKENSSDVTIKVKDSEDKITIKNAHSNDWQVEEIHFANGEVLTYEEMMKEQFKYYGDDSDNTITSYGQKAYVKAGAGNDTITTSGLDDEIYAEDGDDTIQAGYGNDTIVGGKGNDYLQGGEGSDTYIFSKGDGQDIIEDYDTNTNNKDTIQLGADILNTIFKKEGNNLNISFADNNDSINIQNWYSGSSYQIEEIKDTNGNMITNQKVTQLIDFMSSFETEKGVTWNKAIESNKDELQTILANFWIKEA